MRILAIEEVATGADMVMSAHLLRARKRLGVSLADAAAATGAGIEELALIEGGEVVAFANQERLRLVVLAYCDYLGIEPGPVVARLEPYANWRLLDPPNLFAPTGSDDTAGWARSSLGFMLFGLGLAFLAGWIILL